MQERSLAVKRHVTAVVRCRISRLSSRSKSREVRKGERLSLSATITVAKSALTLGKEIAGIIEKADQSSDVTRRVLLYLKAAQTSVRQLGLERQRILTDVSQCDIGDPDELKAIRRRLHVYLHEDNYRIPLESSIRGLGACREAIKKKSKPAWWNRGSRTAAVAGFESTLKSLESALLSLTPGYRSGVSIHTLIPIYDLISKVNNGANFSDSQDSKAKVPLQNRPGIKSRTRKSTKLPTRNTLEEPHATNERLASLVLKAYRDQSHMEWYKTTGEIEALIAELQMAFSIKVTSTETKGINHADISG